VVSLEHHLVHVKDALNVVRNAFHHNVAPIKQVEVVVRAHRHKDIVHFHRELAIILCQKVHNFDLSKDFSHKKFCIPIKANVLNCYFRMSLEMLAVKHMSIRARAN
jgi:hypothetical protein